jgi:hypothetical protein
MTFTNASAVGSCIVSRFSQSSSSCSLDTFKGALQPSPSTNISDRLCFGLSRCRW